MTLKARLRTVFMCAALELRVPSGVLCWREGGAA